MYQQNALNFCYATSIKYPKARTWTQNMSLLIQATEFQKHNPQPTHLCWTTRVLHRGPTIVSAVIIN